VILLVAAVDTDGDHVVGAAIVHRFILGELIATNLPAHQVFLALVFMIGSVSSSTAPTLLGSPAVASVVVAVVTIVVVVVVPEASVLPSLSQLLTPKTVVRPPIWPSLVIPLTKDNAKDKNEEEDTEEEDATLEDAEEDKDEL